MRIRVITLSKLKEYIEVRTGSEHDMVSRQDCVTYINKSTGEMTYMIQRKDIQYRGTEPFIILNQLTDFSMYPYTYTLD